MPAHVLTTGTPPTPARFCERVGCDNPITQPAHGGNPRRFCSNRCRAQARRDAGKASDPPLPEPDIAFTDALLIQQLQDRGFTVSKPTSVETHINLDSLHGDTVRFGVISDTHLGSKWQQLTHLRTFMAYAIESGVEFFVHCGDVVDGSPKMHRDAVYNMFKHGYTAQRDYAVEALPVSPVPVYTIAGNHDYSFINGDGGDVVSDICSRREDYVYGGPIGAYMHIGPISMYLHHPFDGGAYALSYKLQKWIEQVDPAQKPHLVLKGNYHKAIHLPAYRNVEGFLVPSFQDQTPFMKGKSLGSVIGGLIIELTYGPDGIRGLKTEWRIFHRPIENDYPGGV